MLGSTPWLFKYLGLFPRVDAALDEVIVHACLIEDDLLKTQALASIENKAFHCYGGAVMALLAPPSRRPDLVSLIVALQTISDYLDNLCDRAGVSDETAFLRLHQAMQAAVSPGTSVVDYYDLYPGHRETQYLRYLVEACQTVCRRLPALQVVQGRLWDLISYYSHLQAYKHMPPDQRELRLQTYLENQVPNPAGLAWWELAAATGSTLAMFALLALAGYPSLQPREADAIYSAYFPWICGLHILLDYLIDQEEDRAGGDLNFVFYYPDLPTTWQALHNFLKESRRQAVLLPRSSLHRLVVAGLLAMYMSDHKVELQGYSSQSLALVRAAGAGGVPLYHLCRLTRRLKGFK